MDDLLIAAMLTATGQCVANTFSAIISSFPPSVRPAVIGQLEAIIAGTRATFTEGENSLADQIRDASKVVTIVKDPENGKS